MFKKSYSARNLLSNGSKIKCVPVCARVRGRGGDEANRARRSQQVDLDEGPVGVLYTIFASFSAALNDFHNKLKKKKKKPCGF